MGLIAERWGWQAAFGIVGLPGLLLALLYVKVRDYPTVPLSTLHDGANVPGTGLVATVRSILHALCAATMVVHAVTFGGPRAARPVDHPDAPAP